MFMLESGSLNMPPGIPRKGGRRLRLMCRNFGAPLLCLAGSILGAGEVLRLWRAADPTRSRPTRLGDLAQVKVFPVLRVRRDSKSSCTRQSTFMRRMTVKLVNSRERRGV